MSSTRNLGAMSPLRRLSLVALATLLGAALLSEPAHAKGPVSTFPPTNMEVSCDPNSQVTANVPGRTKLVRYSYFKADPYFDYGLYATPQQPGLGYWSFESGPGYERPSFPAVWQKGGPTYPTDRTAVMVMAAAYPGERSTRVLAFGFATCFGASEIPVVFTYAGTSYLRSPGGAIGALP